MTAVTPVPSKNPFNGLPVRRKRMTSSLLPATFFSPSPISAMPNRNSAIPLSSEIRFAMLNAVSSDFQCYALYDSGPMLNAV